MPRQVRIQFAGAFYHVMARGDRREAIFRDDKDRTGFLEVLAEACGRTGWICHAYVLMDNHFHLVIETPEPNLVAGMSWMQNTYTRRHNVRHKLWGHLFGGRYKAVLVEANGTDYLPVLIDYVHLNPARAGLVSMETGLELYKWSSLAGGYLLPRSKRPAWLEVERGLRMVGLKDDARGRRGYLGRLEQKVRLEGKAAGREQPEGTSLQMTLRRGWCFGSQGFKEAMLKVAQKVLSAASRSSNQRKTQEVREHGEARAEQLVVAGMKRCKLTEEELEELACGDERKVIIALAVKRETTVALTWIAQRLKMGTRSTVSRETTTLARKMETDKKLKKRYETILVGNVD